MPLPGPFLEALTSADPAGALRDLDEQRMLTGWIPELEAGRGFEQPELHYYDVLDHNLATVAAMQAVIGEGADNHELRSALQWFDVDEALSRAIGDLPIRAALMLSALVHDIAKPETAVYLEDRLRFPRHGPRGSELLGERLPAAGLDAEATDFVTRMVRYHLRPAELVRNWPATDHAVRRFTEALDGHVLPVMLVNLSDGMATRGPRYTRDNFRRHCSLVSYVTARAWSLADPGEPPLITGEDLLSKLDFEGGRLIGAVLTSVREAQTAGRVRTREEALALARETLEALRPEAEPPRTPEE